MKSILFVDDEKQVLEDFKKMFKTTEWAAYFAGSAEEALEMLTRNKISIIVVDIRLTGTTAIQLLKMIKQQYPLLIRLVLGERKDEELVFKAFQGNLCRYYLEKPKAGYDIVKVVEHIYEIYEKLTSKELLSTINNMDKLPVLPDTYFEINQLIDDDRDIGDIVKVIEKDASLTLKILHMANSAFYRLKTGDIKTAVLNLGIVNIKNIIFASAIFGFFDDNTERKKLLWEHALISNSLVIGIYNNLLNKALPLMYSAAGILHDIGKVILCKNFSSNYMKIFNYVENKGYTFVEAENEILGKNHSEVGAYLLDWWSIPIPIVNAALYHDEPMESDEMERELVSVVHLASYYSWKNLSFNANEKLDEQVFEYLGFTKENCEKAVKEILNNNYSF